MTSFEIEKYFIDKNIVDTLNFENKFYGYCSCDEYYHYKKNKPSLDSLYDDYAKNCGVFTGVLKRGDQYIVFTDPLAQYPVFYYEKDGDFCVSNDFYKVAAYSKSGINKDAINDYLTYFSPLGGRTLVDDCFTLPAGSIIVLSIGEGKVSFEIKTLKCNSSLGLSYDGLLEVCASRMRSRAKSILEIGKPLVHLTGGLDSRLAFSAILAASETTSDFTVFCLGDAKSQDKIIFNRLVRRYDLSLGQMTMTGGGATTESELGLVSSKFNALKVASQSNFIDDWDPNRIEVTGYFSEGLLKDFGGYEKNGEFLPFDYAKTVSCLPDCVFDATAFRMYKEVELGSTQEIFGIDKSNLLYINNRSKAHFGMQSVVNNSNYSSMDLLYDPMLSELYRIAPYKDYQKKKGVVILDLIKVLVSEELAIFPLADKNMPVYGRYHESEDLSGTCFKRVVFDEDFNDIPLTVHKPYRESDPSESLGDYKEYIKNNVFNQFFSDHPELLSLRDLPSKYGRSLEVTALVSIFGVLHKLKSYGLN